MNTASTTSGAAVPTGEIKRLPIVISLMIGAFLALLNETLLGVALTDLMQDLKVSYSTIQWLTTGYMLLIGILVPVTALLIQWFTTRQIFISAMVLFFAGTLIAGLSPSFGVLLVARLVQALGTGLLLPVMMNTILTIYPPEKRGAAMGTIGLVIMFAPAIGPTLAGLILDSLNWRWLFFSVLPLALFSIIFAFIYLRNVSEVTRPKVDIFSILLSTIGFGGIVYGFSSAGDPSVGWSSPLVITCLIAGAIGLILFVLRQVKLTEPVLDMRTFKYPMFSLAVILMVILMMTLFSTLTLLPMFMISGLGLKAFTAGLILLPGGIINGFMSPVTGRLFDRFGPRALVIPGIVIMTITLWMFTRVTTTSEVFVIIILHSVLMIGLSMVIMPAQTTGLNQLPRPLYPHGTAIMNTIQQVAGAVGTALFISIMSSGQTRYLSGVQDPNNPKQLAEAMTAGVHNAFWFAAVLTVLALILSLFMRRSTVPHEQAAKAHV
ncbi:DHA2 family efflux MFS transporter permease subunit [Paenibacillus zeisoli]|uniref:DHA2 family efflux MFS transporter permease subunit n=1 Tax=Paenibacillus zeisoli TaxID=2496267 RepID=A0A433X772_9BACL|nr:MDR family MFS transporter [Paenibacillus zeisoli]RUT29899.1 DHA2 family efflux MFS transporter permease subunit [Paenibacillus zeisoli]